jgi:hypothetical protein
MAQGLGDEVLEGKTCGNFVAILLNDPQKVAICGKNHEKFREKVASI